MTDQHTTMTVTEYNRINAIITLLRWKIQKARELMELERWEEAKALLIKSEDEP